MTLHLSLAPSHLSALTHDDAPLSASSSTGAPILGMEREVPFAGLTARNHEMMPEPGPFHGRFVILSSREPGSEKVERQKGFVL
jgi:hypothetical protein